MNTQTTETHITPVQHFRTVRPGQPPLAQGAKYTANCGAETVGIGQWHPGTFHPENECPLCRAYYNGETRKEPHYVPMAL